MPGGALLLAFASARCFSRRRASEREPRSLRILFVLDTYQRGLRVLVDKFKRKAAWQLNLASLPTPSAPRFSAKERTTVTTGTERLERAEGAMRERLNLLFLRGNVNRPQASGVFSRSWRATRRTEVATSATLCTAIAPSVHAAALRRAALVARPAAFTPRA